MIRVRKKKHVKRQNNLVGYLFISPWIAGFFVFSAIPIIASMVFSFSRYDILSPPEWIGISNYLNMFADDRFWNSVQATFYFVFVSVPLKLLFALMIAMLFDTQHRGVGLYRTIYYIPSIIGESVAVAVMWRQIFNDNGALNAILALVGIKTDMAWIGNPYTAIWTIILLAIWQFGSPMLIFLAGLKQIPQSYYEAAIIDGAGAWRRFTRITLPLLSPIIFFNLVMQLIGGFKVFTQGIIITNGGKPLDTTLFYSVYLYFKAFTTFEMGYGSAMAWVLLILVALLTTLMFKSSFWVYYESKVE